MAMAASSHHSFLTGNPFFQFHNKASTKMIRSSHPIPLLLSCRSSMDKHQTHPNSCERQLAKIALVAVAAGVLVLGSSQDAMAAKSGGRVGGQAFRSAAPRSSGPRINNSRTNVYINPPVAPPLVGGYGYGYGVPFYGGWGWSPFTFFAPGPGIAVGFGGGFEVFATFVVLGAVAAVIRRFTGRRDDDDYDD